MVAVPYLLSQLKAISYSGNGTTGHGSKAHHSMIMRLKKSSGGSVEKDAPCIIHCAGRREKKLFDSVGILFCESNFYSVIWFMYLQQCLG